MNARFAEWLENQGYAMNTCVAQQHRVQKVEQHYGALDDWLERGDFASLIAELTYTTADERSELPNPSRIQFQGNIRNNLASYKNAAQRYARFWREVSGRGEIEHADSSRPPPVEPAHEEEHQPEKQRLALERDLQRWLRREIGSLDPELEIIDDGAEWAVNSGFIDILCRDRSGALVVIELKAGKTDSRVVGQVLGYMGDLVEEDPSQSVFGIIVAHEFDGRTRSAAKAISNLRLITYSISFEFEVPSPS